MLDCTTEKYDDLYDRWLDKPGTLLDWANFDPLQHRLLDLCGGTGAVSKEALKRGAEKVWLLDLNPRVSDARIVSIRGRAEELQGGVWNPLGIDGLPCDLRGEPPFDFVVCRQAIGYLDLRAVARSLHAVTAPEGKFVFNTFRKPKWSFQTYRRTSSDWTRRYFEASAYLGRNCFHIQARIGAGFDVTRFRWHTEDEILAAFTEKKRWGLHSFENKGASLRYSFRRLVVPAP